MIGAQMQRKLVALEQAAARRKFLLAYAEDPASFLNKVIDSQTDDLAVSTRTLLRVGSQQRLCR